MNQMVNKDKNNNNSSNSLVFGQRPPTKFQCLAVPIYQKINENSKSGHFSHHYSQFVSPLYGSFNSHKNLDSLNEVDSIEQGIIIYRAIYFGAYDTAKAMADNPGFLTKFAIAQVSHNFN